MITVTAQFSTVEEAAEFLVRAGHPMVTIDQRKPRTRIEKVVAGEPAAASPVGSPAALQTPAATSQPAASVPALAAPPMPGSGSPVAPAPSTAPTAAAPKVLSKPVQVREHPATLDHIRMALREVFNGKGATVATNILKKFGAARVSDVKPADFGAFIAECANPTVSDTLPLTPTTPA